MIVAKFSLGIISTLKLGNVSLTHCVSSGICTGNDEFTLCDDVEGVRGGYQIHFWALFKGEGGSKPMKLEIHTVMNFDLLL